MDHHIKPATASDWMIRGAQRLPRILGGGFTSSLRLGSAGAPALADLFYLDLLSLACGGYPC